MNGNHHILNWREVLQRLAQAGLRAKLQVCDFMEDSVVYNGHQVNRDGVRPTVDKMEAVMKAPEPSDVTELQSYLGLINYYGRFLQNLSLVLEPLNRLLRKGARWSWVQQEAEAFQKTKDMMTAADELVHYVPRLKLVVMHVLTG